MMLEIQCEANDSDAIKLGEVFDFCGDDVIEIETENIKSDDLTIIWINKEKAIQIISHLQKEFNLNGDL